MLNRILGALSEIAKKVELLSLFSPNETLEDISTRNLSFLFVPYVLAEVENRVRKDGRQERMAWIRAVQVCCIIPSLRLYPQHRWIQGHYGAFHDALRNYEVVPESLNTLYSKPSAKIVDPAKRREVKIKQYKQEKEFRSKINVRRDSLSYDRLTLISILTGN